MKTLIFGSVCLFLWLLLRPASLPGLPAPPQAKAEWTNVGKIVAVGDIHGAYEEFIAVLQELGLVDQQLNWAGGKTHFVQTGDSIDRGVADRKVLDLLMALEKQAEKAGGRVHPLLGNHEVMNIIGDLRYVARESFAAFANEKSEELREKTYARYLKYRAARAERQLPKQSFSPPPNFKEEWMTTHPPGYLEHRKAFSEAGLYGRWLGTRNALLKLNDTVFLHGGLSEAVGELSIREINERIRRELRTFYEARGVLVRSGILEDYLDFEETMQQVALEINYLRAKGGGDDPAVLKALGDFQASGNWFLTNPNAPLWYRGLAQEPEETLQPLVERLKANFGAARFVLGHTPSPPGITTRFSGAVVLIDTGLLRKYYKGRCAALVLENGQATPLYPMKGPCL
jgi:hypothetical protein